MTGNPGVGAHGHAPFLDSRLHGNDGRLLRFARNDNLWPASHARNENLAPMRSQPVEQAFQPACREMPTMAGWKARPTKITLPTKDWMSIPWLKKSY